MLVFLLILVGALAHATWNLLLKRSAASGPVFLWLTATGGFLVVAPIAIVLVLDDPPAWPGFALLAFVSGVLHVAYFASLQAGYRVGDVSVVYPLARGTGPLLSVVLAIPFLGERPGPLVLAGAAAVVVGVVLIGLAGGRAHWRAVRPGVLWGLLVGLTIAAYTLWDAHAVTVGALNPIVYNAGTSLAESLLLAPLALRRRATVRVLLRRYWRAVLAVSVLGSLSYILILFAMQLAPVSIVAPAREISVVFVAIAGWLLFREPHPAQRLTGALVVVAGVALLAASR